MVRLLPKGLLKVRYNDDVEIYYSGEYIAPATPLIEHDDSSVYTDLSHCEKLNLANYDNVKYYHSVDEQDSLYRIELLAKLFYWLCKCWLKITGTIGEYEDFIGKYKQFEEKVITFKRYLNENKEKYLDVVSNSIRVAPIEFNNQGKEYFNGKAVVFYTIAPNMNSETFKGYGEYGTICSGKADNWESIKEKYTNYLRRMIKAKLEIAVELATKIYDKDNINFRIQSIGAGGFGGNFGEEITNLYYELYQEEVNKLNLTVINSMRLEFNGFDKNEVNKLCYSKGTAACFKHCRTFDNKENHINHLNSLTECLEKDDEENTLLIVENGGNRNNRFGNGGLLEKQFRIDAKDWDNIFRPIENPNMAAEPQVTLIKKARISEMYRDVKNQISSL